MSFRSLLPTLFAVWALFGPAHVAQAEAAPEISLLTIGPGDALAERFGHSALLVTFNGKNLVVNFGAAPFEDPKFIFDYLRGNAQVEVVASDYQHALARYRAANRTVERQRLNLSLEQTQALARELWASLKPPRNRYVYDQLRDNCATRVRDLIDAASRGALRRLAQRVKPNRTFRSFTLEAGSGHWFAQWAFDLVVGPNEDRAMDGYQEMYLPLTLRDAVAKARTEHLGIEVPLADPIATVFTRQGSPARSEHHGLARLLLVGLGLLSAVCVVLVSARSAPIWRRVGSVLLSANAVVLAIFGLMVWPLVMLSQSRDLGWNENVLLFWPTDLVLFALVARFSRGESTPVPRWLTRYLTARSVAVLAVLVLHALSVFNQANFSFIAFGALALASFGQTLRKPAVT